MATKIKYSNTYSAKYNRIKRLPKVMPNAVSGLTKRDLIAIKKIFHDGIKDNTLGLESLADMTIQSKTSQGFKSPDTPLYGKGDSSKDRSYMNMLEIKQVKGGWKLQPSNKQHWSKKLKLKDLFMIHEHGATIKRKSQDGGSTLIKIPPRPALLLSYRQYLSERAKDKKEISRTVKSAIKEYINESYSKELDILIDYNKKDI